MRNKEYVRRRELDKYFLELLSDNDEVTISILLSDKSTYSLRSTLKVTIL